MTDTAKPSPLIELAVTLIVPSLIMMAALYYLARSIHELAGLKLAEALKGHA